MNFRSTFIAFGVFSLSGLAAGADEALNTCNMDIEGATLLMSRDEIVAEWSSRGYVKPPPAPPRRSRRPAPDPDPDKGISVQTADGLPNDRFISSIFWTDKTNPKRYDGQPYYELGTTYQPPAGAAGLEAYKQFLRNEITSWCHWATPILEGQSEKGAGGGRAQVICGRVLAGEFITTQNGIPAYPQSAVGQTWNGCNWTIRSENSGRLTVRLSGPVDLTK